MSSSRIRIKKNLSQGATPLKKSTTNTMLSELRTLEIKRRKDEEKSVVLKTTRYDEITN